MCNMKKEATFEESIVRLEELVSELESGALTLSASLEAYSEAVKLAKSCSTMLDAAEQKIMLLRRDSSGEVIEEPFLGSEAGDAL